MREAKPETRGVRDRVLWIFFGFLGLVFVALGLFRSQEILAQTGAVDFRNRVVAARVAELGQNPYTTKWRDGDPETLLDPSDERGIKYTRLTSPPTTLWFHSLFAGLPYPTQKNLNFVLNWLALFAVAGWIGSRLHAPPGAVLLVTGIYSLSTLWQFHVERGQQYSYFALLLTLAVFPPRERLSSVFQAFAAFFRPTAGLVIFAAFRERKPWRSILVASGIGAVLLVPTLIKYPLNWWADYFASAHDWYFHAFGLPEHIAPASGLPYPTAPEGDPTLSVAWNFGAHGSILHHFAMKFRWLPPYALGLSIVAAITVFAAWKLWRARGESHASFAARFFSAIYLADYFLPAPRSGYNAALFFPALVLAMIELTKLGRPDTERSRGWAVAAALGLFFSLQSLYNPDLSPMLVEFFFVVAAAVALSRRTGTIWK